VLSSFPVGVGRPVISLVGVLRFSSGREAADFDDWCLATSSLTETLLPVVIVVVAAADTAGCGSDVTTAGASGTGSWWEMTSEAGPPSGTEGMGVLPEFACTNLRRDELDDFRSERSCNSCCNRKLRTVATDFATSALAAPSMA
jgi:hypothetical protein